jgi:hypothetical protein
LWNFIGFGRVRDEDSRDHEALLHDVEREIGMVGLPCHSAFAIRREIASGGYELAPGIDPKGSSLLDAPNSAVRRLPFSITAFARRQI